MDFLSTLSDKYGINLNSQQKQAVNHVNGPALVLAGPGSGKTTVITARTAFLILEKGINSDGILTLTFNRAAKLEMEQRFKRIYGSSIGDRVHFSTLHSFCNLVVRDYENKQGKRLKRIEGEAENIENKRSILKNIYQQLNACKINDDELEDLISEIGLVKNKLVKEFEGLNFNTKNFQLVYKAYEDYKKSNLYMDFDDMLTFAYSILVKCPDILSHYQNKFRYIQVDEGQDLSNVQFEILKLLVGNTEKNLFIVADDDQSIYGFRGAEPQYIVDIEKQLSVCKIYKLENNYRSSKNIVEITSSFIKANKDRYDKNHTTENEPKSDPNIIQVNDECEQAKLIIDTVKAHHKKKKNEEIAVLYRNNLSSIVIADALDKHGIKFNIKQNKLFFFNHWVVLDVLAFLKFALNQNDKDSFLRIYYKMNRYISKAMIENAIDKGEGCPIIDGILTSNDLQPYQRKQIAEVKNEFKQLAKLRPLKALDYVEKEFKYFDSIKEYCENTGLGFDYLYSFFGILKTIASDFQSIPLFLQRLEELILILEGNSTSEHRESITLTTTHSSKGLEFDCVLMVDLTEDEFPGKKAIELANRNDNSFLEEERRLFYVGMTRSKEHLYLISPKKKNGSASTKSLFISEVEKCMHKKIQNEVCEGLIVIHKHFGEGVVIFVDEEKNGRTILEISFKGIRRKMDLETCITNGLLLF